MSEIAPHGTIGTMGATKLWNYIASLPLARWQTSIAALNSTKRRKCDVLRETSPAYERMLLLICAMGATISNPTFTISSGVLRYTIGDANMGGASSTKK